MTPSFTEVRKILIVSIILVYSVRCTPIEEDSGVTADDFAFDWRDRGVISPVRDQDKPHYWDPFTIALTEGMETLLAMQTGQPAPELSGWEVADCCVNVYHQSIYPGYNCFINTGGLCTQAAYNSSRGKCENDTCQAVVKVTKSEYIATGREDLMVDIIHKVPLTALIDASRPSFTKYVGGIYSEPTCSSTVSNHVVQVVGYGTATGVDYWIIKNCWGTGWGEQGYMRIARGKNMCGIGANAFYPISQQ